MNKLIYYTPFYYLFKTRLKKTTKLISWLYIYVTPVSLSFLFYTTEDLISNIFKSLISIVLIYTLYEIGYIYNDTETIKKEKKPTLRLSKLEIKYYYSHKIEIYLFRISIALILSLVLFNITDKEIHFYILSVWLILFFYFLYNSIRNIYNLPLHFILVSIRYCATSLLFGFSYDVIFYLILSFPILNLLERSTESKFNINSLTNRIFKEKTSGRVLYYTVISILSLYFLSTQESLPNLIFFLFSVYYLIYRLALFLLKIKA